jgi:hypothetical protein
MPLTFRRRLKGRRLFRELEQQDVAPAASMDGFTAFPEGGLPLLAPPAATPPSRIL